MVAGFQDELDPEDDFPAVGIKTTTDDESPFQPLQRHDSSSEGEICAIDNKNEVPVIQVLQPNDIREDNDLDEWLESNEFLKMVRIQLLYKCATKYFRLCQ